jgi:hypothetical protein
MHTQGASSLSGRLTAQSQQDASADAQGDMGSGSHALQEGGSRRDSTGADGSMSVGRGGGSNVSQVCMCIRCVCVLGVYVQ